MQLNDLRANEGAKKARKRIGRGNSAGGGTTAGRGTKGQLSRWGGGKGVGFEGGQNPLAMRLPKLGGFKRRQRVEYSVVNVGHLNDLFKDGETVDAKSLVEKGVIKSTASPIKVLGEGEISHKLTISVNKVSKTAQEKIEACGGKVE